MGWFVAGIVYLFTEIDSRLAEMDNQSVEMDSRTAEMNKQL
jgi:hypothetical protein